MCSWATILTRELTVCSVRGRGALPPLAELGAKLLHRLRRRVFLRELRADAERIRRHARLKIAYFLGPLVCGCARLRLGHARLSRTSGHRCCACCSRSLVVGEERLDVLESCARRIRRRAHQQSNVGLQSKDGWVWLLRDRLRAGLVVSRLYLVDRFEVRGGLGRLLQTQPRHCSACGAWRH